MTYTIEAGIHKGKSYKHLTITKEQQASVDNDKGNHTRVQSEAWAEYKEHPLHTVFYQRQEQWYQDNVEYFQSMLKSTGIPPLIWYEDLLTEKEMEVLKQAEAKRDQKTREAWETVREARIALYGSDLCGMPLDCPLLVKVA